MFMFLKGWNGEKRSLGRRAAGRKARRNQRIERQEEAGRRRQGTAGTTETAKKMEKDGREHLLQRSGSQGGGQGCW